ncbi:MAG TPA: hypothetical protein VKV25_05445, partial [Acidimicrobiales bacterium]|nr:hypothetical protein [Acidimicrobiales bacterium]
MATARDPIGAARGALAAGDLSAARAVLADAARPGGWPRAHLLLGELCMADDDFDAARHHWEAAFGELRRAGDLA